MSFISEEKFADSRDFETILKKNPGTYGDGAEGDAGTSGGENGTGGDPTSSSAAEEGGTKLPAV